MQPDVEIRLKAMIKAMTEVVLPAVDAGNAAAIEQARLVTASLAMVAEQIDHLHCYAATEARALSALASALTGEWQGGEGLTVEHARDNALKAAARSDVPTSVLTGANRDLRGALCAALETCLASEDSARRARIEAVVLSESAELLRLERAFVAKSGFDVAPHELATIGQTLADMRE